MKLTKLEMKVLLRVIVPLMELPPFRGKRNEGPNTDAFVDWLFEYSSLIEAITKAMEDAKE